MAAPSDPLGLTLRQWEDFVVGRGLPRYRGRQIFDGIHRRGVRDYACLRELPRSLREELAEAMPIRLPRVVRKERSSDGSVKYAMRLDDDALVEAVGMPGEAGGAAVNEFEDARAARPTGGVEDGETGGRSAAGTRGSPKSEIPGSKLDQGRALKSQITNHKSQIPFTVCLSSQTGCAVDCAFCVTGRLGGGRNLTAGEILGQLYAVLQEEGRSWEGLRVVFMGMGEPFLNPEGVLGALDILFERLSPRRVTVSTSGIAPAFATFARRPRRPNLAVSLNAADEETRAKLMPISRTYPLSDVLAAMRSWPLEPRRRFTVEYVLIAGRNDSSKDAFRLSRLLRGLPVKVNVIPLNEDPVYLPGWKRPDEAAIENFVKKLAEARMTVTVRRSKGPDARAGCGQLKGRTEDVRRRATRALPNNAG